MRGKFFSPIFIILIGLLFYASFLNAREVYELKYFGCSGIVDLNKNEYFSSPDITEETLKRISAEITRLYHKKGYSAFYIEQIIVKADGSVEFYFNESMVSSVLVSGTNGDEAEQVKDEIFTQGTPYNDITLKKNISLIKKKYGYSNVHIGLERDIDKKILIKAEVVKITNKLSFSVTGSPVYGAVPSVSWDILSEKGVLHLRFDSSFAQKQTRMSDLILFYDRRFKHTGLLSGFYLRDRKDYSNGEMLYTSRSISPEVSVYHFVGAMGVAMVINGDCYLLENYDEPGRLKAYSGYSGVKTFYDNRSYVLDKKESKNFFIEAGVGGSSLGKKSALRVKSGTSFSFPVFSRVALIFKNYFFLTTERERLFQEYVFDNNLPGRLNDYTVSSLKNSAGLEAEFELYPSLFYAGPLFYYGVYEAGNDDFKSFSSAGLGVSFYLKGAAFKGAYVYDIYRSINDGSFFFSVSGNF